MGCFSYKPTPYNPPMETKKVNMKEAVDSARELIENDKIFSPRSQLILRKVIQIVLEQQNNQKNKNPNRPPFHIF